MNCKTCHRPIEFINKPATTIAPPFWAHSDGNRSAWCGKPYESLEAEPLEEEK